MFTKITEEEKQQEDQVHVQLALKIIGHAKGHMEL